MQGIAHDLHPSLAHVQIGRKGQLGRGIVRADHGGEQQGKKKYELLVFYTSSIYLHKVNSCVQIHAIVNLTISKLFDYLRFDYIPL